MELNVLVAEGKARLVQGGDGQPLGIVFDDKNTPSLLEMVALAKELEAQGAHAETPLRFLLGDTVAALERMPGMTKRELVEATFSVFHGNVYHRLRKYAHVARAYPHDALFVDGSPRRRVDVPFCFLQELAPKWVPDDFRQQMLQAASRGEITIQTLRARLEVYKPRRAPASLPFSEAAVIPNAAPVTAAPHIPVAASVDTPWEEDYARIVSVPPRIPGYVIAKDIQETLELLHRRACKGQMVNLFLCGETGCGKTSLARQFAAETGRRFFLFNCGTMRSESEWWGVREAEGGRTFFRPSAFVYALQQGNVIIVLDEVNRVPAHLLNPLLNLLDDTRATTTPGGQYVQVASGTIIVGTANLGEGGYVGTYQLDSAFQNRLGAILPLPPPSPAIMKSTLRERTGCSQMVADLLAKCMEKIKTTASPNTRLGLRQLLEAALWTAEGASLRRACQLTLLEYCALENPGCRGAVENILDGVICEDMARAEALVTTLSRIATKAIK